MSSPTVCVVGAGVIGLSVALYLAQEQIKSNPDNPVDIGASVPQIFIFIPNQCTPKLIMPQEVLLIFLTYLHRSRYSKLIL